MLTLKVNGRERKVNIGCRTFISLERLLGLLSADDAAVTLNGITIERRNFGQTTVMNGATLILSATDSKS